MPTPPPVDVGVDGDENAFACAASLLMFTDPDICRATRLSNVTYCAGSVLSNSAGSASTYGLSKPVAKIDTFISHNWCVPRMKKLAILAVHFNFDRAFVGTVLAFCLHMMFVVIRKKVIVPGSCIIVSTFALGLVLAHHLDRLPGCHGHWVFLDKVCIHQTDPELMRMGIEKLTAFVAHSQELLVCYSDVYLHKLWTVYEAATFLILGRTRDMCMVPVQYPLIVLTFLGCGMIRLLGSLFLLGGASADFTQVTGPFLVFSMMVLLLSSGPIIFLLMRWEKVQREAVAAAANFNLNEARCAVESDRPLVIKNVLNLMRHQRLVPRGASDDAVLAAFNRLVREKLPIAFRASAGRVGVPWKILLLSGLMSDSLDGTVEAMALGTTNVYDGALELVAYLATMVAWLPLMVAVLVLLERRFHARIRVVPRVLFALLFSIGAFTLTSPISPLRWNLLMRMSVRPWLRLVFLSSYTLGLLGLTRLAFRPKTLRDQVRCSIKDVQVEQQQSGAREAEVEEQGSVKEAPSSAREAHAGLRCLSL